MKLVRTIRTVCLSLAVAAAAVGAAAQGPGGRGMRGGGMGMPGGGGRMGGPARGGGPVGRGGGRGLGGTPHGGLAPTGRWWDDKKFANTLGISGEQQKRMDSIFQENRDTLQQRYDAFVKAQARLEALKANGNPSESALFSEIDHTSQARAELEQAYTHMQLQLRGEMSADQIGKLDDRH